MEFFQSKEPGEVLQNGNPEYWRRRILNDKLRSEKQKRL